MALEAILFGTILATIFPKHFSYSTTGRNVNIQPL